MPGYDPHSHNDHRQDQKQPQHASDPQRAPHHFDLAAAALDEMHEAGFAPEFGDGVQEQVAQIVQTLSSLQPEPGVEDLRALGWSSIDNDTSRDLDQIEVAERTKDGIQLRVAIGDVASAVALGSPIDKHAQDQTQTIYTAVQCFLWSFPPALPR